MKILPALLIVTVLLVLPPISESRESKYVSPPEIEFVGGYSLSGVSRIVLSVAEARRDVHKNVQFAIR